MSLGLKLNFKIWNLVIPQKLEEKKRNRIFHSKCVRYSGFIALSLFIFNQNIGADVSIWMK